LWPDTQFVFVAGYAGKTILDHRVDDLETNFLQKPFTLRQLPSKIRRTLGCGKAAPQRQLIQLALSLGIMTGGPAHAPQRKMRPFSASSPYASR